MGEQKRPYLLMGYGLMVWIVSDLLSGFSFLDSGQKGPDAGGGTGAATEGTRETYLLSSNSVYHSKEKPPCRS